MEQNELEKLLSLAAERLGTTPEQLKAEASSGELSSLLTQLSPTDAQSLQRVLSDRDAAQKLLSSPEAQELLRYLHQP
jgi:hypothetical protein